MHELSICQALIDQVTLIAREQNASQVYSVQLSVGPLSGVEPHLLEQAYSIAAAGTIVEGAELRVETLPVRVHCSSCNKETDALPSKLVCGHCGDWQTTLISGDELMLRGVELSRKCA